MSGKDGAVLRRIVGDGPGQFCGVRLARLIAGAGLEQRQCIGIASAFGYLRIVDVHTFDTMCVLAGRIGANTYADSMQSWRWGSASAQCGVAIGVPPDVLDKREYGEIWLYSNVGGGAAPPIRIRATKAHVGEAWAVIADIDNDGCSDVLTSESTGRWKFLSGATVVAYSGRTAKRLRSVELRPSSRGQRFGASVVAIGDLNKDNVGEIAVGAPVVGFAGGDREEGPGTVPRSCVYIINGCDLFLLATLEDPEYNAGSIAPLQASGYGEEVTALPDINRDGVCDFAVAARNADDGAGRFDVISGSDRSRLYVVRGRAGVFRYVGPLRSGGDYNGDVTADCLCGREYVSDDGVVERRLAVICGKSGQEIREHRWQ